jgi:hypothetical protein
VSEALANRAKVIVPASQSIGEGDARICVTRAVLGNCASSHNY